MYAVLRKINRDKFTGNTLLFYFNSTKLVEGVHLFSSGKRGGRS